MPGLSGKLMVNSDTDSIPQRSVVDFSDTKIAFAHKTDAELRRTAWLFNMINKPWLVKLGGSFGLWLNEVGINIFNPIVKATIYKQFCGGVSLLQCQDEIEHLRKNNTLTILDYGAEGKSREEDFETTLSENINAVRFASTHESVPVISTKVTALASMELLQRYQSGVKLSAEDTMAYERLQHRLDKLCKVAREHEVAVFIDAEETWIQDTIDRLVKGLMEKYNHGKVVVYHTYQLYRKDKLQSLLADHTEAKSKGYILGAKLVRGAYMEKERMHALGEDRPSPIHDSKENTDMDYDEAVRYCVDHYEEIASCNASHNLKSNLLQAELIVQKNIPRNHSHLNFCQLFGMSDIITFNLASAGFNVAKYVPYGPVKDVIPYLIRRARENTAVTGEMSRELSLILSEMKRRGLK